MQGTELTTEPPHYYSSPNIQTIIIIIIIHYCYKLLVVNKRRHKRKKNPVIRGTLYVDSARSLTLNSFYAHLKPFLFGRTGIGSAPE